MQELRLVLIIVGALAIAALLFHGLWTSRKEKPAKFGEKPLSKIDEVNLDSQDIVQESVSDVRVVNSTPEVTEAKSNQPDVTATKPVSKRKEPGFSFGERPQHDPLLGETAAPSVNTAPKVATHERIEPQMHIGSAPQPAVAPQPTVAVQSVAAPQPIVAAQPVVAPQATVAAQPVVAPQPTVAAQPVAAPQPTAAAQPVVAPQPTVAAQPVAAPQPIVAAQPVAAPQPIVAAQPVAAPQPIVAAQPVVAPQPTVAAQPVVAPQPVAAPQPIVAAQSVPTPIFTPVVEDDVKPQEPVTKAAIIETVTTIIPEPEITPEPEVILEPEVLPEPEPLPPTYLSVCVHARKGKVLRGPSLFACLERNGLIFGENSVFHRHADLAGTEPVIFSVTNLLNPGTFPETNYQHFETPGIGFFLMLPCYGKASSNFNMMLQTAQQIADQLNADVMDQDRVMITPNRIAAYREKSVKYNQC
ncbi:cell division protein ZipA [Photobacterium phosphoreum]|uniref:cell division protein ZipA n=1 Tax=Photobacterium phosphoreum TaxID=659 RepID=UPI000CF3C5F7|nr:cell division protein ZipA [Photobacterium phosphoreum]PQJ90461.1 cell division protein ZipA [Photobacterium phosphoreum]PSV72247.1 cell division protein ZipA [Photobacterium phosphoreum]